MATVTPWRRVTFSNLRGVLGASDSLLRATFAYERLGWIREMKLRGEWMAVTLASSSSNILRCCQGENCKAMCPESRGNCSYFP